MQIPINTNIVEKYRQIRPIHKNLNQSVITQCVTLFYIITGTYTLGILKQNRKFLLRYKDEINHVIDFVIYEVWDR